MIPIAFGFADFVALLAVVEAGVVGVVVPGRRGRGFRGVGDGQVPDGADAAPADGAAGAVVVVGGAVLAVLRAVLVLLGGAVGGVVVFRGEGVGLAAHAAALRGYPGVAPAVLARLKQLTFSPVK